ncbi:MAG: hypothetical protein N4A47_04795 [Clostridia bacterium]|nr:hypothetical protein [Clostridia bacterium]
MKLVKENLSRIAIIGILLSGTTANSNNPNSMLILAAFVFLYIISPKNIKKG